MTLRLPAAGSPARSPLRAVPLPVLALLALSLLALGACGGGGGSSADPEPTAAFFLQSSTPTDGAVRVPLDATVYVTFNAAVDVATVETSTLTLRTEAGAFIAGSTSILASSANRTLRFTTVQSLAPTEVHICTVAASLRSAAGDVLEGTNSIQFTAIDPNAGLDIPSADQLRPTTGMLAQGRQGHTATLLDSGLVLIAGGFSIGGVATDSAEVFSVGTETFATLPSTLTESRAGHTATLLFDGRVLLAGGWWQTSGGSTAVRASAEVYDPVDGSFSAVGSMAQARADHAAVRLPDGRVLLTGGSDFFGGIIDLDDAEVFDPLAETFSPAAMLMTTFRSTHGMVMRADGTAVLAGGSLGDLRPEVYDFFGQSFTPLNSADSDAVRFGAAMTDFASGAVAVAGGENLGTVLHINTANFVQNTGSGLTVPRSYATATRIKADQILIAGGINFSNGGFIESSCDLLIEGGAGGSNTYPTPVRFTTGMAHHTATLLSTGDILFCGGINENGSLPNKRAAFVFDVE
jgi:hypothetical protein